MPYGVVTEHVARRADMRAGEGHAAMPELFVQLARGSCVGRPAVYAFELAAGKAESKAGAMPLFVEQQRAWWRGVVHEEHEGRGRRRPAPRWRARIDCAQDGRRTRRS